MFSRLSLSILATAARRSTNILLRTPTSSVFPAGFQATRMIPHFTNQSASFASRSSDDDDEDLSIKTENLLAIIEEQERKRAIARKLATLPKPITTPPAKPLSAYDHFREQQRSLVSAYPEMDGVDASGKSKMVTKKINEMWRGLSAVEKEVRVGGGKPFEAKAKESSDLYRTQYAAYLDSRTPEDIAIEEKRRNLELNLSPFKSPRADPAMPKRPKNGYQLFMQDMGYFGGGVEGFTQCGKEWKALSDEQQENAPSRTLAVARKALAAHSRSTAKKFK
ncbi:hypothetical protein HDU98_009679 [Podochytrium sp. JEL0797]|nr:hypothetical protein HDU98_009679 [Podochytrium sp. JEL0797]